MAVNILSTNLTIPDADPSAVNVEVPANSQGPVVLTICDDSRKLSYQLLEIGGSAVSPAPHAVAAGSQVVLFEVGEKVGELHGYAVWHDGSGNENGLLEARDRI